MAELTGRELRRRVCAVLLVVFCAGVLLLEVPVVAGWRADRRLEEMMAQPSDLPPDWEPGRGSQGAGLLVGELISDGSTRIWSNGRLQVVQTVERYHTPTLAALLDGWPGGSRGGLPPGFDGALPGAGELGADPEVGYRTERYDGTEQSVRATVRRGQYLETISVRRIFRTVGYAAEDRSPLTPAETADAVRRVDAAAARGSGARSPLPWHVLVWALTGTGAAWSLRGTRRIVLPRRPLAIATAVLRLSAPVVALVLLRVGQDGGRWASALLAGLALWAAPALLAPRPAPSRPVRPPARAD
ncbi:hypothetical protein [Kitasatospora sp. NPDC057198]|uniref:hypothetical protein n=1 Tax=Kitasatospora sp. NPDC057198 TaxID=3346046 RepID=UPI00362AB2B1